MSTIASVAAHGLLFIVFNAMSLLPGQGDDEELYELTEIEAPEPEKPPEIPEEKPPEPEPDPEPADEPPPEEPPPEKQPPRPKKVKPAPVRDKPVSDEPPPPLRFDQSSTVQGGNTGVSVNTGTPGGTPGGTGKPNSKGKGSRPKDSEVGKGGEPWAPRGELYIKSLPVPRSIPEVACPAVRELGIEGVVVLKVQVQKNGKVRKVTVAKGIGHGCDKIAARALRKARFKPAVATNGQPADYELRYEYEFQLVD